MAHIIVVLLCHLRQQKTSLYLLCLIYYMRTSKDIQSVLAPRVKQQPASLIASGPICNKDTILPRLIF